MQAFKMTSLRAPHSSSPINNLLEKSNFGVGGESEGGIEEYIIYP